MVLESCILQMRVCDKPRSHSGQCWGHNVGDQCDSTHITQPLPYIGSSSSGHLGDSSCWALYFLFVQSIRNLSHLFHCSYTIFRGSPRSPHIASGSSGLESRVHCQEWKPKLGTWEFPFSHMTSKLIIYKYKETIWANTMSCIKTPFYLYFFF